MYVGVVKCVWSLFRIRRESHCQRYRGFLVLSCIWQTAILHCPQYVLIKQASGTPKTSERVAGDTKHWTGFYPSAAYCIFYSRHSFLKMQKRNGEMVKHKGGLTLCHGMRNEIGPHTKACLWLYKNVTQALVVLWRYRSKNKQKRAENGNKGTGRKEVFPRHIPILIIKGTFRSSKPL